MKAEANRTAGFRCKYFQYLLRRHLFGIACETNVLIVFNTYAEV